MRSSFLSGDITVSGMTLPVASSKITIRDFFGSVMVRWGINRSHYTVAPGLYAIGSPGKGSDVFVTANYKLSFDALRRGISGENSWILVLDTRGVNVWCAAGKGTFGTKELVNRIKLVSLEKVVSHRRLILPQLGATGVAAHKVREESGFNVHYGPVRAADIKRFTSGGYRADREMRKVNFGFKDRLKLIPNDFIYGKFYFLAAAAFLFVLSGVNSKGFSSAQLMNSGGPAVFRVFLAYLAGIVITPFFLPYLPGRMFSLKGFFAGTLVFMTLIAFKSAGGNVFEILSWFFIITAISSFLAMNFTGSTTFTSLSGVKKEMKISIPFQIGFAITGIILQVVMKFI